MFSLSLCLCNCTSLSDASQHVWYIDKFPLSVFSSWLFPGNVQERGGGRHRRQAESRPGFPDGLYHIDWLVKYISYHIKPAQGHDISFGKKKTTGLPKAPGKQLTRSSAFARAETAKTIAPDLLHVLYLSKAATGKGWFLWFMGN